MEWTGRKVPSDSDENGGKSMAWLGNQLEETSTQKSAGLQWDMLGCDGVFAPLPYVQVMPQTPHQSVFPNSMLGKTMLSPELLGNLT